MLRTKDYLHLLVYLLLCLLLLPSLGFVLAITNCDATCQCFVSENNVEKGVIHVRPNCTQGKVTWRHPYNAIRLGLNPLTKDHEFETCVKIETDFVSVKVYEENFGNIEGLKTLFVVSGGEAKEYCRKARSSVTLYIEPERSHEYTGPPKVVIYYERYELRNLLDPMRECRPCEEEELLKLFCTSDYIFQGVMGPKTTASEIEIYISKHIFGNKNVFYRPFRKGPLITTVMVPEKCKIQRGVGDFLFIARNRFDKMHLIGAPYLSHWEKIKERALQAGTMQCSYD